MRNLRLVMWVAVAVVGIVAAFLVWRPPGVAPIPQADQTTDHYGGPFALIGGDGQPFSSTRLAGRPFAIFFGFTRCPDVCPTTLARMTRLRKTLGKGDGAFAIVFVTVDPQRDKPTDMARYAGLFGSPVIGLTGSSAAIEQVQERYGIFSKKVLQPDGDYTVDHTATVLLFDSAGKFTSTIAVDEGDDPALDKLKVLTS